MAHPAKRLPANVPGNFFVDSRCINCDVCRQLAPTTFVESQESSAVAHQPGTAATIREAYQALVACPVGAIGTLCPDSASLKAAVRSFPVSIVGAVYYNGFNSERSFGAHSYLLCRPEGNWLIDAPRYARRLVDAFESLGGLRYIFLTHADDVGDADRYAERFGAMRIIHRADAAAMPDAEWQVSGHDPLWIDGSLSIIPVPGHTPGSMALLADGRYLFSGDHLWWDSASGRLDSPSELVSSSEALWDSNERLLEYSFDWLLPGHGERVYLPNGAMRREITRLVKRRAPP